ncbi:nickel pincer cofactor biosynthesis protein LarB [Magnetococcales bacterium HHB-1]
MSPQELETLLNQFKQGEKTLQETTEKLRQPRVDTIKEKQEVVARLDRTRSIRQGFPEVVLAEGKRFKHLDKIAGRALQHNEDLLITRVTKKRALKLCEAHPQLQHAEAARCLYRKVTPGDGEGLVAVLCAGTSDVPVAEEAALTARMLGARVETHFDAGVAGLHRLLAAESLLRSANVFIVAAGMEGALPSVVGGLVSRPVIAVPTSVGYGAAFSGGSALLGMLNSCSANVTVVNIDNGFGAGFVAGLINRLPNRT